MDGPCMASVVKLDNLALGRAMAAIAIGNDLASVVDGNGPGKNDA